MQKSYTRVCMQRSYMEMKAVDRRPRACNLLPLVCKRKLVFLARCCSRLCFGELVAVKPRLFDGTDVTDNAWAACRYDEFDNALEVMMAHDAAAWEHVRFKDVAVKCSTVDIFYKAIQQYFDYHPDLINDLLKVPLFYLFNILVNHLAREGNGCVLLCFVATRSWQPDNVMMFPVFQGFFVVFRRGSCVAIVCLYSCRMTHSVRFLSCVQSIRPDLQPAYRDKDSPFFHCVLQVLEGRIDHTRVVSLVRRGAHLGVVKDYLLAVQKNNLVAVNEAINELHISEDDYEGVDTSVAGYDNFDQLRLAEELEVRLTLSSS